MIYAIIGVILLLVVVAVGMYNSLIQKRNVVDEGWSGIDVQLKRRYDLIPNLVETVKGYAKHEAGTLEEVVKLRNSAMSMSGADVASREGTENQISQALKSIFALAESYPDLKANQNFLDLQGSLTAIESDLQNARRYYNGTVRDYNTTIQMFPGSIFAGIFGFAARAFFAASEDEKQNVKVAF
jgi:LemA protein